MKVYMKNFGIWLGAPLVLLFLLPYVITMNSFLFYTVVPWIVLIGGTIMGIVKTHQEIGGRIELKKAFGPVVLFIGGLGFLGSVLSLRFGMGFGFLQYMLIPVIIKMLVGISILLAAGTWYMFEKAGKPGWGFLIPIYNLILMCEIAKKPGWWVVMFFIPIANIIFLIMMFDGISKNFGKDSGFTVGLIFLRQIFFAVLGYGSAVYVDGAKQSTGNGDLLDDGL
ncbi:MAG: hypothetical protein ACI8XB_001915 [Patiriisocius sp.]|jgi:hypothetical protein